jgi:putative endonuclease
MIASLFESLRDLRRRKQWDADRALGRRGEDLAHRYLRRAGFVVVARNYRLPSSDGEADLIAWDGPTLVFVEVKTRMSAAHGPPERAIGPEKLTHMMRVAREYSRKSGTPWERIRFDAVSVTIATPPAIEHLRGIAPARNDPRAT